MSVRKKRFPCNHVGKGKYCHRCAEIERIKLEKKFKKNFYNENISNAPIQLSHLPNDIVLKTITIINKLKQGKSYYEFNGKRLFSIGQRYIISIPLGNHFRLICFDNQNTLFFLEAISHEEYNKKLSTGGWKNILLKINQL